MNIEDNFDQLDIEKDAVKAFQSVGIDIKRVKFLTRKVIITGRWEEFFDFPIPEELMYLKGDHSHEYIINHESPNQYILIECSDLNRIDEPVFMRGEFSINYNGHTKFKEGAWFSHLKYEVYNDFTVTFVIRGRDSRQRDSDPYIVLELIDSFHFIPKFKKAIEQVQNEAQTYL